MTELLETLPTQERLELTAWLLQRTDQTLSYALGRPVETLRRGRGREVGVTSLPLSLPAGEESQLVTIRLPAVRHAQLRAWCAEHDFTMAAVVRGLVERFLEQQAASAGAPPTPTAAPEISEMPGEP
jgi:hypothetical protein